MTRCALTATAALGNDAIDAAVYPRLHQGHSFLGVYNYLGPVGLDKGYFWHRSLVFRSSEWAIRKHVIYSHFSADARSDHLPKDSAGTPALESICRLLRTG